MEVTGMTSDSEEQMVFKGGIGSPCTEEASSGGSVGLSGVPVKKGPWTSTEDAILMDYVKKHGEGNWNAVQKHSGLARCGKSCRLRWTNHLRPDLKKGSFTPEEERRIVELHAKMGNKWAKMALELPGRTDNEIKNYWNTRIKRRQRAGLPIYPADICLQALTESQSENMYALSSGNNSHTPDLLPFNGLEIPAVEFKSLDLNHRYYSPPTLNIPPSNLHGNPFLAEDVDSSYSSKYLLSAVQPTKRFRRSESLLPGLNPGFSSGFPGCTKIHKDASVPNLQSFWFNSEYYQNPALDYASSSSCVPSASQNFNGVSVLPSSEPTWAMKELPSLQTQTGSWAPPPSSPLPSLESVDALFQSPPIEHTESGSLSPRNSGLLDAVLYESRSLKTPKNDPCQQKPEIPTVPGEVIGNGNCNASCDHDDDVAEWDSYLDPNSPLGHSAASVFSNYTTPVSGSSLDEPQSFEAFPGSKLNTEGEVIIPTELSDENNKKSNSNDLLYTRPDFLLGSNYFRPQTERGQHIYVERSGWSPTW